MRGKGYLALIMSGKNYFEVMINDDLLQWVSNKLPASFFLE